MSLPFGQGACNSIDSTKHYLYQNKPSTWLWLRVSPPVVLVQLPHVITLVNDGLSKCLPATSLMHCIPSILSRTHAHSRTQRTPMTNCPAYDKLNNSAQLRCQSNNWINNLWIVEIIWLFVGFTLTHFWRQKQFGSYRWNSVHMQTNLPQYKSIGQTD